MPSDRGIYITEALGAVLAPCLFLKRASYGDESAEESACRAGVPTSTPSGADEGALGPNSMYFKGDATLAPSGAVYSKTGCFDTAPTLNVVFGALDIPGVPEERAVSDRL